MSFTTITSSGKILLIKPSLYVYHKYPYDIGKGPAIKTSISHSDIYVLLQSGELINFAIDKSPEEYSCILGSNVTDYTITSINRIIFVEGANTIVHTTPRSPNISFKHTFDINIASISSKGREVFLLDDKGDVYSISYQKASEVFLLDDKGGIYIESHIKNEPCLKNIMRDKSIVSLYTDDNYVIALDNNGHIWHYKYHLSGNKWDIIDDGNIYSQVLPIEPTYSIFALDYNGNIWRSSLITYDGSLTIPYMDLKDCNIIHIDNIVGAHNKTIGYIALDNRGTIYTYLDNDWKVLCKSDDDPIICLQDNIVSHHNKYKNSKKVNR